MSLEGQGRRPMVVTVRKKASAGLVARGRSVARDLGVPFEERRGLSLSRLRRECGAELLYVLKDGRDEVTDGDEQLFVHPGLFYLKVLDGVDHPLVRAVSPAQGQAVSRIVDATMGLASDALHMACVLEAEVVGIEVSPVLGALLEEGLARLASGGKWAGGASRVELRKGGAVDHLSAMGDGAADVVYLDPMFEAPRGRTPAYGLFRSLAIKDALSPELVAQAVRVAARRVVLKVPGGAPAPSVEVPAPGWNRRVRGQAVDHLVIEMELDDPVYEAPDFGRGSDA